MIEQVSFRMGEKKDIPIILTFIKELASYEEMLDQVVATEEILNEWLFEKEKAEVLITEQNDQPIGFALFFHNFSTFLGRSGIYLEDLYISPAFRGHGYGKALIQEIAKIAVERHCGRLEWSCLDWNQPSIDFYLSLGAVPMNGWSVYRLTGSNLQQLGQPAVD